MAEKILLACYDFPPNSGIGGRRWAKFAKGLVQQGHTVHVIKADPVKGDLASGWSNEVEGRGLVVHSLPRRYPAIVSHGPKNLLDKVIYRWQIKKLKAKEKGTIYDIAIGWEAAFIKKAEELIVAENITKMVATGAPFNLLYFAAKVKAQHPEITLLCDYRDPWLNASNYGMKDLDDKRRQREREKQNFVLQHADVVTAPNHFMLDEIKDMVAEPPKCKLEVLPHFYDPDDLNQYLNTGADRSDGHIRLVYGGSLYIGLETYLQRFTNDCLLMREKHPELAEKIDVRIFTPHLQYADTFAPVKDMISVNGVIGKQIFQEVSEADAVIVFLAEHNKDYLTTKFFEFLPFRKPLLFIGAEGYTSDFIEKNKLGAVLRCERDFSRVLLDISENRFTFNHNYPVDDYNLTARTRTLLKLLA